MTIAPTMCKAAEYVSRFDPCCAKVVEDFKSTGETSKDTDKSDCCPSCSCPQSGCFFFQPALRFEFQASIEVVTKNHPFKQENIFSRNVSDCWQPPERITAA